MAHSIPPSLLCFICFFLFFSMSAPAKASPSNATVSGRTDYSAPFTALPNMFVPETASVDRPQSEAARNCDETCFITEKKKGVSCALVSSAGTLLSSKLGKIIDQYDVVMRSGWAPIKGFEGHVGSRTDIRPAPTASLNKTHPSYGHDGSERVLFFSEYASIPGYPGHDEKGSNEWCEIVLKAYRQKFPTKNALSSTCIMGSFGTNFTADGTVNLYPSLHHPATTGFTLANLLGSLCDTLTLFGFSLSDSLDDIALEAGYMYHYYPDRRKRSRKLFTAEGDVLNEQKTPQWHHDFKGERKFYQERSLCTCKDGFAGVYFLDVNKMRPLPPSVKLIKHDETTKGTSPGGMEAVKQLFQQMKKGP